MRFKDRLLLYLLYLALLTVFVSYMPIVYNSSLYSVFGKALLGIMLLLFIFSFFRMTKINNTFITKLIILLCLIALEFLIFFTGNLNFDAGDVRQILIVILCIMIGFSLNISKESLKSLCFFYSIGALVLGVIVLLTYTGSFSFAGDRNAIDGKNQVGGIVAIGAAISFYYMQITENKKIFYQIITFLLFLVLALVRCRSAFVSFLFFVVLLFFKRYPFRHVLLVSIGLLLLYLVFYQKVNLFFESSLIGGRGSDINDLSTGRMERNMLGLEYFFSHLLTGELLYSSNIPWIHNYLLLRLVHYGIWSIFFIYIYFMFVNRIIKEYRHFDLRNCELSLGFFVVIIPFFVSLLEPSYPFGPGTVQVFAYILFGYSLRQRALQTN